LTLLAACAALSAAGPSAASASYDFFDDETLNDVNVFGQEIPYESGAPRVFTASFDTSDFTLEAGEDDDSPDSYNTCVKPPVNPFTWGGRTAWARFDPGVAGELHAVAETPGYDSIIWIREARQAPWGATTFTDLSGRAPAGCGDSNLAAGNEEVFSSANAANAYYIQVGGKCPGDRTTCHDPSVPGGPTTIRVTFTPSDADGDGIPDTKDLCLGGERGLVTPDGCPDTDQDGIRDSEEGPDCVGQKGVPAPMPWNGCFDGPDPPRPGGASVVIKSLKDGNPDNTPSVNVILELNWPRGARRAVANNSAGDPDVPIPLQASVPWQIRPAETSATREVEVKFTGPNIDAKDSDTITLDPLPPRVSRTLLLPSGSGRWFVGMRAVDDRRGSGVSRIEVLDSRRRRTARGVRVCDRTSCRRAVTEDLRRLAEKPAFLRAVDAAGNRSKPKALAVASGGCRIKVPLGGMKIDCYQLGDTCNKSNPPYWKLAHPALKCKNHKVKKRRRR
jgi:hypothetical protein